MGADVRDADQAAAFEDHLRHHASHYFAEEGVAATAVRLVSRSDRPTSVLFTFALRHDGTERLVLVKAASAAASEAHIGCGTRVPDRPRIAPFAETQQRFVLEHSALTMIHDHFSALRDSRFGSIRVLDVVPRHRALVMERVNEPPLRDLVLRAGRRFSSAGIADLERAFNHAGAWLREFHSLPVSKSVETLHATRADIVRFTGQLAAYLAPRSGALAFLSWVEAEMALRSREEVPAQLPLGLAHGDFAMRNILVGRGQRVSVLDLLGRHRMPIYRDIAYFLANLSLSCLPAAARGSWLHPWRLPSYRRAFVSGYFGAEAVPIGAIHLFEAQALLERWSSVVWHCSKLPAGRRIMMQHTVLPTLSSYFRRTIREKLTTASSATIC